jgi:aspartate/methionine/tyrosine aminotransferase
LIHESSGLASMNLPPFQLERYFAQHEFSAPYLLCPSDLESVAVGDLLALETDAAERLHSLWLGYTETAGDPALRTEIAGLYESMAPQQVLVHAGAEEAIFNFMQVMLEAGDHVIVQWPGYQSLAEVARTAGCEVTLWRMHYDGGWSLDTDELGALVRPNTRAVVINSPHNPTGYLFDRESLDTLISLAERRGFAIFSDEVYRGLEHDPAGRQPALCDLSDCAVSLGVLSKTYGMAGLRIGWIASRNRTIYEAMAAFKDYTTICNSAPSELLATIALRHRDSIVERNLELVQQNLSLLDAFFATHANRFEWTKPQAGPVAFPRLVNKEPAAPFCARLIEEAGVLLLPGDLIDPESASHFRIGFGRRNLPEALEQLSNWMGRSQ